MDKSELGDKIAREIAPDAWKEFDQGKGVCSNSAGFACIESIKAAGRVIKLSKIGLYHETT
jgi:hypothetical protein